MILTKDPVKVASGGLGGRTRWDREAARRGAPTGPRILRLDTLTPEQRRLVMALVDAARSAPNEEAARVIETPRTADAEVRRDRATSAA